MEKNVKLGCGESSHATEVLFEEYDYQCVRRLGRVNTCSLWPKRSEEN